MAHIKTYARIKPSKRIYEGVSIVDNVLHLRLPEVIRDASLPPNKRRGLVNHQLPFNHVFGTSAKQHEVFSITAHNIITDFLAGFNGTIFAYGQTGTGKTYTVEGSARQYNERGLAPRAVSLIYKSLEQRQDEDITLHLSYMEIYQDVGYDLLNPGLHSNSLVATFPKVIVTEGVHGSCLIRKLSSHLAANEGIAQALLLQGELNRKIAETPVNDRSSRSHAVFTIHLEAKKSDSDVVVRSKLHLVDLAGSERVAKTGVDGHQLTEAKAINLSLHHLENVIVALQQEGQLSRRPQGDNVSCASGSSSLLRPSTADSSNTRLFRHIPYRNSLLTMVLRDSLGGNCNTAMIATVSLEAENLGESLSTCRFAQRVACISNHVTKNEEIDDKCLIRNLKRRILDLETELECVRYTEISDDPSQAVGVNGHLKDNEKTTCAQVVQSYLGGRISDPIAAGITHPQKFRECMRIMKKIILQHYASPDILTVNNGGPDILTVNNGDTLNNTYTLTDSEAHRGITKESINNSTAVTTREAWVKQDVPHARRRSPKRAKHDSPGNGQPDIESDDKEILTDMSSITNSSVKHPSSSPGGKRSDSMVTLPERPRSSYKSPYERKREREIHKMDRKLDQSQEQITQDKESLAHIKQSIYQEDLRLKAAETRSRLQLTKEQLHDQHGYLLQLTHNEADADTIDQEKKVHHQLRKCQAKLSMKLEEITKRFEASNGNQPDRSESHKNTSVEKTKLDEKYWRYKKQDGSLNTLQVYEMLRNEEKKLAKDQSKLERDRVLVLSKQVEVKENATRQKLQDFKAMLRKAKSETPSSNVESQNENVEFAINRNIDQRNDGSPSKNKMIIGTEARTLLSSTNSDKQRLNSTYALEISNSKNGDVCNESHLTSKSKLPTMQQSDVDTVVSLIEDEICKNPNSENFSQNNVLKTTKDKRQITSSKSVKSKPLKTYVPSEYVYKQLSDERSFDARRMELSSKSFDSVLSSMLRKENESEMRKSDRGCSPLGGKANITDMSKEISSDSTNIYQHREYDRSAKITSKPPREGNSGASGSIQYQGSIGNDNNNIQRLLSEDSHFLKNVERIKAIPEMEKEERYVNRGLVERNRVNRIRKARRAASVIQKAWRQYNRKQ